MKKLILQLGQAVAICAMLLSQSMTAWAQDDALSQAELDQMLAPVALYPDTVLTHVLIAATYPLEIVQASRWAKAHPELEGDAAVRAVDHKDWDPSVKALVAFPQLLQRLSSDLEWTQQLGEAFLEDESQIMASIQGLRQKAYTSGNLNDNKHVVVERERDVIVIEPARKEIVYVPVYDTRVVYGDWWWPHHPPVYWHTAGVYYRNSPFHWGISVNVRPWFYFGIFDWHRHHVVVHHHYYRTPPRYYPKRHKHYVDARRWQHNTEHRRGVHYRHERLNREYNAGYGYRQPTREIKGNPVRHTRVEQPNRTHEYKQYQRKTAEQVRLPERNWRDDNPSPRQVNEALRQQRSSATAEQRVRSTDFNNDDRRQLKQQLREPKQQQQHLNRPVREQQMANEPQRQRDYTNTQVVREQRQRDYTNTQAVREQRQPQQVQQRQQQAPAPRSVNVERRESREPARQSMAQTRDRPAKHID
jgi:hypothetical protein